MFKKFLILGVTALSMVATSAIAADASRARLMVPASVDGAEGDVDSQSATGYDLHYVFQMGVGVGLSNSAATIKFADGSEQKDSHDFLNVSYVFGESFTTQIVLGYPYGAGDVESSGTTYKHKSVTGSAFGLNFGYDFGGFEALLGYRSESTTQTLEVGSGETEYERSPTFVMVGVGFTF